LVPHELAPTNDGRGWINDQESSPAGRFIERPAYVGDIPGEQAVDHLESIHQDSQSGSADGGIIDNIVLYDAGRKGRIVPLRDGGPGVVFRLHAAKDHRVHILRSVYIAAPTKADTLDHQVV